MRACLASLLLPSLLAVASQQVTAQDVDKILEKADQLLAEAKAGYEAAREKSSVDAFVDAGFKLEEARIKFIVIQEIGSPEKQKAAAERLRAVNQLSKLLHDGKVAISGRPAEAPASKPAASDPVAPSPAPTPPQSVDVTKRAPVPDPARQRDAEKQVRELFKDQYVKKTSEERRQLAQSLLAQAAKSQDDLIALWVLYREAQEVALLAGDVKTALNCIELSARAFDIDALALRNTALASAAKTAKTPEDFTALTQALLKLIEDFVAADQFDAADKAATAAVQHSKKSGDPLLVVRTGIRAREVAEAKTLHQSMKGVLETLAKSPEDPAANLEVGKFLCFVKGTWDLGIRFLVKGSDPTLRGLAQKEVTGPAGAAELAAVADGWWDLATKEKSPLRKTQLQTHAKLLYEMSLSDAPALLRAKIEKRLDTLEQELPSGTIDLIRLIDPKRDTVLGEWTVEGRTLTCAQGTEFSRLMIPYQPPDEYDLTVVVERKTGEESFYIGLARGTTQCFVGFDAWVSTVSGIGLIDGRNVDANETTVKGSFLPTGRPCTIVCSVRREGITVSLDEKKLFTFKGNFNRLTNPGFLKVPDPRALYIGTNWCRYSISKLTLVTVSGQGKKAR